MVRRVKCANCNKQQPDSGLKATCSKCGCSPLPSYSYPVGHWLHPKQCGCEVGQSKLPVRKRKTKLPQLEL